MKIDKTKLVISGWVTLAACWGTWTDGPATGALAILAAAMFAASWFVN